MCHGLKFWVKNGARIIPNVQEFLLHTMHLQVQLLVLIKVKVAICNTVLDHSRDTSPKINSALTRNLRIALNNLSILVQITTPLNNITLKEL